MKLQDAFVAETGAYYGSFTKIGYEMPGKNGLTGNFQYASEGTFDATHGTAAFTASNVDVWSATNQVKLNDCAGNAKNWKLGISQASGQTNGQYTWKVTMGANCDALTPSFSSFDNSSSN